MAKLALHPQPAIHYDQDFWAQWITDNAPRFLLFARQQARSQEDAEDIFQDALLKLVKKVSTNEFIGEQDAWPSYLYTSIRRLAIDLSRSNDRRRKREDLSNADVETEFDQAITSPWFENEGDDDETRHLLESGLKLLPAKFSEVLILKIWGDKTFAEIGKTLDISQNTAASRYRYGIDALKKHLSTAVLRGDIAL